MGNLTPNTVYIYERVNGTVYRRESGADPSSRQVVGYNYHELDYHEDDALWREILATSKRNETLRSEIERVKILYLLLKEESNNLVKW